MTDPREGIRPSFDLSSERAVVGAVLRDCRTIPRLTVDHFTADTYRRIYQAARTLERGGKFTLPEIRLALRGRYDDASIDATFLADLTREAPPPPLLPQFVDQLFDFGRVRRAVAEADAFTRALLDGDHARAAEHLEAVGETMTGFRRQGGLVFEQRSLDGVLDPNAGNVPYLVDQLFPEAAQTVIAAGWKTGKTLAVYHVLLACVLGEKAFGRFPIPKPITTCVLQLEMPGYEDDRRFRRLCIGMGCDPKEITKAQADGRLHYYNRRDINLYTKPEHALDIRDYCVENGIELLIIDNIGALYAGIDLNDASQVRLAHDRAMQPILGAGITVVILHHHSKLGMDPRSDDRVALLGSQAWGAVSARIYTLRRVNEDQLAKEADPTEFYIKFALTGTWSPAEFRDVLLHVADTDEGGTEMYEVDRQSALVESSTDKTNRVMLHLLSTGKINLDSAKPYGVSKSQYDRGSTHLRKKGWMLGSTTGQMDDRRITQAGRSELQKLTDLHGEPEIMKGK